MEWKKKRSRRKFLETAVLAATTVVVGAPTQAFASSGCSGDKGCATSRSLSSYKDLERAFVDLGKLPDPQVKEIVSRLSNKNRVTSYALVPLPGPQAIIACVLTAAWIFRRGTDRNRVIDQLTEVVIGCVGIPGLSKLTPKVAKLIWNYRKKIAAALTAAGLTNAQIAPLLEASPPKQ